MIGHSMVEVTGVQNVHDLHVWSICSGHLALSAHIITTDQKLTDGNEIMAEIKARLARFGIQHTTIQWRVVDRAKYGGSVSRRKGIWTEITLAL
jgi:cobalt-zinc-cadmium efflux system protein